MRICLINSLVTTWRTSSQKYVLSQQCWTEVVEERKWKLRFRRQIIRAIRFIYNNRIISYELSTRILRKTCFLNKSFMSRFFLHKTIRCDNFQRVTTSSLRHLVGKLKSCFKEESFARCTNCIHRREYTTWGFLSALLLLRTLFRWHV